MNYNTIISERQDRGEVFTPITLVEEMLDKLPKEVFESKTTTFLDPCFGTGSFLRTIGLRLKAAGHSSENINSRLFGFEVDSRMFNETKRKFNGINISKEDFLNTDINMKFDVIVGNPPYQNSSDSGSEALWLKFILKSSKISDKVLFITPKSWCNLSEASYNSSLFNIFKSRLSYANISNNIKENYFKGIGSTFSYFLLTEERKDNNFIIESDSGSFKLSYDLIKWIPSNINLITLSILNKTLWSNSEKLKGSLNEITGYRKGGKHIHSNGLYKVSNTSAQYSKDTWLYTNVPQDIMNLPKVIFSDSGYNKPYYDSGSINLGHHSRAFFVKDESEANDLINFLESDLIKFLIKTTVDSGISIGFESIAKYIPSNYKDIILTQEEIDYIENAVK